MINIASRDFYLSLKSASLFQGASPEAQEGAMNAELPELTKKVICRKGRHQLSPTASERKSIKS
jgi:hypothetical protein